MARRAKCLTFSPARLRELREAAGLSVAALAEKAGLSRGAVHKLETGEIEPRFNVALRLAAVLRVDVKRLAG